MAPKSRSKTPTAGPAAPAQPPPPSSAVPEPPVPSFPSADSSSSVNGSAKPVQPKVVHLAYPLPVGIPHETIANTSSLLRLIILGLICGAAVGSRLFAVIRFESVIHEL